MTIKATREGQAYEAYGGRKPLPGMSARKAAAVDQAKDAVGNDDYASMLAQAMNTPS